VKCECKLIICESRFDYINIEGGYICEKDSISSYHMKISLTGSMHVGRIIIKAGESIRGLTGEQLDGD
jgi:hypothetical protein